MKKLNVKNCASMLLAASIFAGLMTCTTGCSVEVPEATEEVTAETTEVVVSFDKISAKDDYFGYVNGELLSCSDVLWDYDTIGAFGNQQDILLALQDRIIEIGTSDEDFEYGSKEYIIREAFKELVASCDQNTIDEHYRNELPKKMEILNAIKNAKTPAELMKLCIENHTGLRIELAVDENSLNPSENWIIYSVVTNVLGVEVKTVIDNFYYVTDIADDNDYIMKALGYEDKESGEIFKAIETLALEVCWKTDEEMLEGISFGETAKFVEFIKYDDLNGYFTNLNLREIEEANGITNNPYGGWYSAANDQIKEIDALYTEENLEVLKNWAVIEYVSMNSDVFALEYSKLPKYKAPQGDINTYAAYSIASSAILSDITSQLYVEMAYDEEADKVLRDMIDDIIDGYRVKINSADWLSDASKKSLIEKLDNIIVLTAKDIDPDKIDKDLAGCFTGDYWDSNDKLEKLIEKRKLDRIGQVNDRTELRMPMHMVNACYTPLNTVNITLAIQSAPFFDKNASFATNLGGIGTIVGHEIGHGFDSNCIVFDMDGKYNPEWLSSDDVKTLEERNKVAVNYFETAFKVYEIYTVDGEQTLGENYADLGGMEVCVSLLDKAEDYDAFFHNYATIWASLTTIDDLRSQIKSDVHSPAFIRVNSILACIPEFYETYDVKEGDGMYIAPENRIGRWN